MTSTEPFSIPEADGYSALDSSTESEEDIIEDVANDEQRWLGESKAREDS